MDPLPALRTAYVTLLADLADSGRPVPLYAETAPNNAVAPYVLMTSGAVLEANTKNSFGYEATLTLDVVTRHTTGNESWAPASRIASEILARLKPTPISIGLVAPGFNVWRVKIDAQERRFNTPSDTIYRKLLLISHSAHPV